MMNGANNNNNNSMDNDLERVFELVVSRSQGQVQTDAVEEAVSQLLHKANAPNNDKKDQVQQDLDNYDDLEEQDVVAPVKPRASTRSNSKNNNNNATTIPSTFQEATLESMRQEEQQSENNNNDALLEQIPLGKSGSRMMVTFGDGPSPKPEAVEKALLGARLCLQMAIKDARALRRHEKVEYNKARKMAQLSSKQGKLRGGGTLTPGEQAPPSSMVYRAMQGWDKLAYDPKCGFDVEQLRQLFPEEMQAYTKWNEMHESYKKSSEETGAPVMGEQQQSNGITSNEDDDTTSTDSKPAAAAALKSDVPITDGHLQERAAQFDVRTDQMKDDWYLKFSEVRRGSFLPKKSGMKKANEKEWDDKRKATKTRGRPKGAGGRWDQMSATCVRFLHWVGFDPRSALPPPNEEVTEALAFLAYDFMGRIVEKAIYLRNVANEKDDKNLLLELQDGEQLEAEDIEKAIHDSTIRPVPLYSSLDNDEASSMPVAASLYFGPGFEDRLEMEMEELASGKKRKRLSPEELEIRQREDAIFAKLASKPPAFDGFADVLNEEAATLEEADASTNEGVDEKEVATKGKGRKKKKSDAGAKS